MLNLTPAGAGKRAISGLVGSRYRYRFLSRFVSSSAETRQSRDCREHAFFISSLDLCHNFGLKVSECCLLRPVLWENNLFAAVESRNRELRFDVADRSTTCDALVNEVIATIVEFSSGRFFFLSSCLAFYFKAVKAGVDNEL